MKAIPPLGRTAHTLQRSLSAWLVQRWARTATVFWRGLSARLTKGKKVSSLAVTRDLNEMVHLVLVIGLFISAILMLMGLMIDLVLHHALPTEVAPPVEAVRRAILLRPSGFLSLGLLTLILTPFLRVIGSLVIFAWERDGRYALITAFVLVVLLVSLRIGQA